MFDLVIRGGTVVDGSGALGRRADMGVSGETIAAVSDLGRVEASRVVEAAGLGIPFVVVNGQLAVDRERLTEVLAGQAVP